MEVISFEDTNQFKDLFLNYLKGDDGLKPFYDFGLSDEGIQAAVAKAENFDWNRKVLVEVLSSQYQSAKIQPKVDLKVIEDDSTYFIGCGHQLSLFLGPLFFIYKICSAIKMAEYCTRKFNKKFLPIYWLASEDHDFDEIKSINVFGNEYSWNRSQAGAVGRMDLDGLKDLLKDIKSDLPGYVDSTFIEQIEKSIHESANLSELTQKIVHTLFEDTELIVLDADDQRLKSLFTDTIYNDIFKRENQVQALKTTDKLEQLGYKTPVFPREINVFLLQEHYRERLIMKDGIYQTVDGKTSYTEEQLTDDLKNNIANYSPNVVLRPLYQQTVIPCVAFIGGPSEVSYWLQLKGVFESNEVFYPLVGMRNSFLLLENRQIKKLSKYRISNVDLFLDENEMLKRALHETDELQPEKFDEFKARFESLYGEIGAELKLVDQSLGVAVDIELNKSLKGLDNIQNRLIKALKRKNDDLLRIVNDLKTTLFPNNQLQEREKCSLEFILKNGKNLTDKLIEECEIFPEGVKVINLENDSQAQ
ncbi:MAG: bacillithiol biosynthesis cysteine-adding enzyme BshC [Flavobacteriales bacterium]|nr:bacillithiol biosynthesis cysteine-adding enzyme BshC [Flavobacteriales bacterium]